MKLEFYIDDFCWLPYWAYTKYESRKMAEYHGHVWGLEMFFLWFGITVTGEL